MQHSELTWVAGVYRASKAGFRVHHFHHGINQVINVAKAAGLLTIAINGDVFALQGLHNEVAHHPAIIGVHAWTISIKDAHYLNVELVLAVVIKKEGFGAALAFVVARANTNRINLAPIRLGLGMDFGVAIDFAGRGLQDPRTGALR